jgi:excisionase family DNA binding protein
MTKEIMDVKEVAEYLALSPTTVYRMLTSGEIPNVKVGGQYRFPKAVIDDWIAGKLELPKQAAVAKVKKGTRKAKTFVRAEDEIIGHLLAARAAGSRDEKNKAKQIMLERIEILDMAYLASKAKAAGVLEEAIAVQAELITEASR